MFKLCLLDARLCRNQRELVVYKSEIKLKRNSRKKLLHPFQIKHLFSTLLAFGRSSWMGTLSRRILVLGLPGFPNSPHSPLPPLNRDPAGKTKSHDLELLCSMQRPPEKKNNDHQNQNIWSVIAISQDHQFSERR